MAQVTWLLVAIADVNAICEYIARDAPRFADSFGERVFKSTDRLGQFPLSGRIVPEFGRDDIREIIVGSYRVIYRLLPEEVEVLTVIHGARLLTARHLTTERPDD